MNNTDKIVCSVCGCVEDTYLDIHETSDGRFICDDCITEAGYEYCEHCNMFHPAEQFERVRFSWRRTEYICRDCLETDAAFFRCVECEEWFYGENNSFEELDGETYCLDCYDRTFVTCAECGKIIRYDDSYEGDTEDDYLCFDCANKQRYIKNYSYKPTPICKGKDANKTYVFRFPEESNEMLFGVELEIDEGYDRADTAEELSNACEDIYIKRDGSLTEDGLEIVTHPCTLEYHLSELGWENICSIAREHKFKSHDTRRCGLHVHVGRYQLGESYDERIETVGKIIALVDRHWGAMKQFSRRTNRQLNSWSAPPEIHAEESQHTESTLLTRALNVSKRTRYMAVNIDNSSTIEFRLFNGSLKPNTIKATLQLVSNICEYAKRYSLAICMTSRWEDVAMFNRYRELEVYLKQRGMTEVESPDPLWLGVDPEFDDSEIIAGNTVFVTESTEHKLIGRYGTVKDVELSNYNKRYTVEFAETYCDSLGTLLGRVPSGKGIYLKGYEIKKVKEIW